MPHSGIREIVNRVIELPGGRISRLEIGEPGFPTPAHITRAAWDAVPRGVGYTPSTGTGELREALAARLRRVTGLDLTASRVVVTQGAVQALSALAEALLDPGDDLLVPDPSWPNYEMIGRMRGASVTRYPLRASAGFLPDPDEVEALITPRTRALVLNSPSNPTGRVFPQELVAAIVAAARRHGVWVLSDEVYDELVFEGAPANAVALDPETVIGVYSFSKTYAMTGWRVGYLTAPARVTALLSTVQEALLSSVSAIGQYAAHAALTGPQECVARMREEYRARRDLAVRRLTGAGLRIAVPHGAFYAMVPLAPGADSRLAALDLVGHGVAVAPGSAFGDTARDHVRISLSVAEDVLETGLDRLLSWGALTGFGAGLGRTAGA
jgi:aspartate/methionine/tyrosine aminotransferase